MQENKYTNAMNSIRAPAIEIKVPMPRPKNRKLRFTAMTAACLALIITAVSLIPHNAETDKNGQTSFTGSNNGNSFSLTVGAAVQASSEMNDVLFDYERFNYDMNFYSGNKEKPKIKSEYGYRYISDPIYNKFGIRCTGDDIESITISMDKGAFCLYFVPLDPNNDYTSITPEKIVSGVKTDLYVDDIYWAANSKNGRKNCYSSVTLAPGDIKDYLVNFTYYQNSRELEPEKRKYYEEKFKVFADTFDIMDENNTITDKIINYKRANNTEMLKKEREKNYNECKQFADFNNEFNKEFNIYCTIRFKDGTEKLYSIDPSIKVMYYKDYLVEYEEVDPDDALNYKIGDLTAKITEYHTTEIS